MGNQVQRAVFLNPPGANVSGYGVWGGGTRSYEAHPYLPTDVNRIQIIDPTCKSAILLVNGIDAKSPDS